MGGREALSLAAANSDGGGVVRREGGREGGREGARHELNVKAVILCAWFCVCG